MPDLLLELYSEEIPARMQERAAEDLKKLVTDRLVDAGLVYEGAKAFATAERRAWLDRGGEDPEGPEEGRLLCGVDREARASGDRCDRGDRARGRTQLS